MFRVDFKQNCLESEEIIRLIFYICLRVNKVLLMYLQSVITMGSDVISNMFGQRRK